MLNILEILSLKYYRFKIGVVVSLNGQNLWKSRKELAAIGFKNNIDDWLVCKHVFSIQNEAA